MAADTTIASGFSSKTQSEAYARDPQGTIQNLIDARKQASRLARKLNRLGGALE